MSNSVHGTEVPWTQNLVKYSRSFCLSLASHSSISSSLSSSSASIDNPRKENWAKSSCSQPSSMTRLLSGGVSSTLWSVNSESKYLENVPDCWYGILVLTHLVSISCATWGLKGGFTLLFSRSDQLMLSKNACALIVLKWKCLTFIPGSELHLRCVLGTSTQPPERILDEETTQ